MSASLLSWMSRYWVLVFSLMLSACGGGGGSSSSERPTEVASDNRLEQAFPGLNLKIGDFQTYLVTTTLPNGTVLEAIETETLYGIGQDNRIEWRRYTSETTHLINFPNQGVVAAEIMTLFNSSDDGCDYLPNLRFSPIPGQLASSTPVLSNTKRTCRGRAISQSASIQNTLWADGPETIETFKNSTQTFRFTEERRENKETSDSLQRTVTWVDRIHGHVWRSQSEWLTGPDTAKRISKVLIARKVQGAPIEGDALARFAGYWSLDVAEVKVLATDVFEGISTICGGEMQIDRQGNVSATCFTYDFDRAATSSHSFSGTVNNEGTLFAPSPKGFTLQGMLTQIDRGSGIWPYSSNPLSHAKLYASR